MKLLSIVLVLFVFIGCKKDNTNEDQAKAILTKHQWYEASRRNMFIMDSSNTVLRDTTLISGSCAKSHYLTLNRNQSSSMITPCFADPTIPKVGTWRLERDSSFEVYIPMQRSSFSTGFVTVNIGIQAGKLSSITESEFTTVITMRWIVGLGPAFNASSVSYVTYKAK